MGVAYPSLGLAVSTLIAFVSDPLRSMLLSILVISN
jgi:hypothetical protein